MADNHILIVAQELCEHLYEQDWVVIDCRSELLDPEAGRRSYLRQHIPGAVFLDLDKDLAGPVERGTGRHPLPDVDTVVTTLSKLGIGSSSKVVVYDGSHGAVAARGWWTLRWLGHASVFLLDGGFARWQELGLPTETGEVDRDPGEFCGAPRTEIILTTEELRNNLAVLETRKLLDARDRHRFRGEREPIDPVAGHIPGSINLPFTDFVRQDGTWLPLAERDALLKKALGDDRGVAWSVMCGSGVTACHLAISGIEAGYSEPRLYVGSWSEWIRDTGRPIATGEGPNQGRQPADLA
jgi:thiosulfate/3-mercaptopyruvate sulfurtransferase